MLALILAPVELPEDGWIAFEQPLVEATSSMGCGRGSQVSLRERETMWTSGDNGPRYDAFTVYLELENGSPQEVRAFTPDCEVTDASIARPLSVAPRDAVALLDGWLNGADDPEVASRLTATLAHIDHADVDASLKKLAENRIHEARAHDALFWLAQRRGQAGRDIVVAHLDARWPLEHRKHALTALALSKHVAAFEPVRKVARGAEERELRAHAVIMIGISKMPGAMAELHSIFLGDADRNVREQAIFGLAQLQSEEAARTLAGIARNPQYEEHRRTALFWLANMQGRESDVVLDELMSEIL